MQAAPRGGYGIILNPEGASGRSAFILINDSLLGLSGGRAAAYSDHFKHATFIWTTTWITSSMQLFTWEVRPLSSQSVFVGLGGAGGSSLSQN